MTPGWRSATDPKRTSARGPLPTIVRSMPRCDTKGEPGLAQLTIARPTTRTHLAHENVFWPRAYRYTSRKSKMRLMKMVAAT